MNTIGLPKSDADRIVEKLNQLLAAYSVLYMNTRGFHWNIKGSNFFELHLKFEEIYNILMLQIDEIAERILTMGGMPIHSYSENLKQSSIAERTGITEGKEALTYVLEGYQTLIAAERELLKLAAEANDEGTIAQISAYVQEQEKAVWMFKAYLS